MQRPQVIITIALSGAIVIAIVVVYHVFDPTNSIYAPKCFLKTLTGYNCPGCGCQRLLYNWANGHFIEGLRYNYFFSDRRVVCSTDTFRKTFPSITPRVYIINCYLPVHHYVSFMVGSTQSVKRVMTLKKYRNQAE